MDPMAEYRSADWHHVLADPVSARQKPPTHSLRHSPMGEGATGETAKSKNLFISDIAFLALIPVFSPLGWGHTYVLMLPLAFLVYCQLNETNGNFLNPVLIFLSGLVMLLPVYHEASFMSGWPPILQDIYYSRWLFLTALFMMIAVYQRANASGGHQSAKVFDKLEANHASGPRGI